MFKKWEYYREFNKKCNRLEQVTSNKKLINLKETFMFICFEHAFGLIFKKILN